MKLYKEYKEELQRKEQEEQDRKEIGLSKQVVVIYEKDTMRNHIFYNIKRGFSYLILISILILIIVGIIYLIRNGYKEINICN